MQVLISKTEQEQALAAATLLANAIKEKPQSVICLATGHSPLLTYKLLVNLIIEQNIPIDKVTFLGLDEWLGIAPHVEGSCYHFLYKHVFNPLQVRASQIKLFNSLSSSIDQDCNAMNAFTCQHGIDLMVVGVGMNGHIGLNEPGCDIHARAHIVSLDSITQVVGQKYFKEPVNITKGITLGLQQVLSSKLLIVIANGQHKSKIVYRMLNDEVSNNVPATYVRTHPNSHIFLDTQAGSSLNQ